MSLITRIINRNFVLDILKPSRTLTNPFIRPVRVTCKPSQIPKEMDFDEYNKKIGRPLSPHLTIYKLELTSAMSLTHRTTGIMLSGYAILLALVVLTTDVPVSTHLDRLAEYHIGYLPMLILKMAIAFPTSYHFFNGIRHLSWDIGKFATIPEVYKTGYIVTALSILCGVGLSLL